MFRSKRRSPALRPRRRDAALYQSRIHPIEATYVFPLDEGAAVCGFEAVIDGTLVVGEVKEREEAFRMYDDAIERGDGAFLLDEERPDVFQASIGNLPPGKEVLVKLTYVTELACRTPASGSRFRRPYRLDMRLPKIVPVWADPMPKH